MSKELTPLRDGARNAPNTHTEELINSSISPNTKRVYEGALRELNEWLDGAEVNDTSIANHIADLHEKGKSKSRCALIVYALNYLARVNQMDSPVGPVTKLTLKGIRRNSKPSRQARGISWREADLVAVVAGKDDSLAGVRDAAIIALASDGLLRISEITNIQVEDVSEMPDGTGRLTIVKSKTDQEGEGKVLFVGKPTLTRIQVWCRDAGIEDGYLFRRVHKGGGSVGIALTPQSVRAIIRKRAAQADLDGDINGHSLRVGSAQSLSEAGAELPALMEAGRWNSAVLAARYIKAQQASKSAVARLRYK